MPLRVTDQTPWRQSANGLRWARHHSGGFEWELSPAAIAASSSAGADELCQGSAPARLPCRREHNLGTIKTIWNIRPKGTSAKNWTPARPESRLHFEWIAPGLTEKCFWTVTRR